LPAAADATTGQTEWSGLAPAPALAAMTRPAGSSRKMKSKPSFVRDCPSSRDAAAGSPRASASRAESASAVALAPNVLSTRSRYWLATTRSDAIL
jgi:hypothetical protein